MIQRRWTVWPLVVAFVVGCQARDADNTSTLEANAPREAEAPSQVQAAESGNADKVPVAGMRKAVATKAKDALFARLSGRLKEVMQSDGPAAAIAVCSQEAVKIAEEIGSEHGVEIGRTSFKLRNPANAARDWVQPFVEKRTDTPQHVQLENGNLGVLFPIHLQVQCLMCHGQPDDILDDVKPELAKRYPGDAATGFQQGDLRGWFWVEVPSGDTE